MTSKILLSLIHEMPTRTHLIKFKVYMNCRHQALKKMDFSMNKVSTGNTFFWGMLTKNNWKPYFIQNPIIRMFYFHQFSTGFVDSP